ncbi:MAG: PD-(D/E)XK nuclease family protein [Lachnospiraceae bacterium]
MSLQFIFGNSGSGKSYALYQYIIKESLNHPKQNYLVLVPEQFTMQTQQDLVFMHPNHGIMNIDVLSFERLAHRIFEEVGQNQKIMLDDEGKNLILRKIAGDCEHQLKVLGSNMKKPGYISEVKSVISEFTQYNIGIEELETFLSTLEGQPYLYQKMQDIKLVYQEFESYLEERYISREELLEELSLVAGKSAILKNSTVVLDGFTGFTPIQNKLLKELFVICEKVMITVTMDQREDPYVYTNRYQLFALGKQMVSSLITIAQEVHAIVEEPICRYSKPVYRFRNNEPLAFLESELFRYSKKQYRTSQDAIRIYCTKNPKQEVDILAQQIRRLTREEGYRYRDIAVIAGDMTSYSDYIQTIFSHYKIPLFMDHKRSVLLNSFVEYLRSLLAMVEQNFTYVSVFRFLRTGLTGFCNEDIDTLENYVIGLGIKGYKRWQEQWVRKVRGMSEEALESVNHSRVVFVEKIDGLVFVLKQRRKTVKDITLALYDFLVKEKLQEQLQNYELQFQKSQELTLSKEYAQIYRVVMELFDKFVELLGEEVLPLREYCELLDAGLEEAQVGVIPPSLDQVVVGDIERTRLKDVKALFLIGANDTMIPGNLGQSGLLSECDRTYFEAAHYTLSPGAKEKVYIQKFYLYLNLTKPTELLFLSYSKTSSDGSSLRPSYLIQDIRHLYPLLQVIDQEERQLSELELTQTTGMEYLIQGLRRHGEVLGEDWKELYTWYCKEGTWKKQITCLLEAGFYEKPEDILSQAVAEELYGTGYSYSVTRLEQFSSCAYSHFLNYGLGLREREEYSFKPLDFGMILHSSLERFAHKLEQKGITWTLVTEAERIRMAETSVEESIADYGNQVLYSSARQMYMVTRIKRLMNRTVWAVSKQLEKGKFMPTGYEVDFGYGKIDRIDTCEMRGKRYVKILDYKTGAQTFDLTSLYYGLQLQLPIYMNAALEKETKEHPGKEVIPAGFFYYRIQDPILDKLTVGEAKDETMLAELKLDGYVNADPEVVDLLDQEFEKTSSVVPVAKKKDQSLSKTSNIVTLEEFYGIGAYAEKLRVELSTQIQKGIIQPIPYELEQKTGCDYCRYKEICGFDIRIKGYEYRRLKKMNRTEVLQLLKEDNQSEHTMDEGTTKGH